MFWMCTSKLFFFVMKALQQSTVKNQTNLCTAHVFYLLILIGCFDTLSSFAFMHHPSLQNNIPQGHFWKAGIVVRRDQKSGALNVLVWHILTQQGWWKEGTEEEAMKWVWTQISKSDYWRLSIPRRRLLGHYDTTIQCCYMLQTFQYGLHGDQPFKPNLLISAAASCIKPWLWKKNM